MRIKNPYFRIITVLLLIAGFFVIGSTANSQETPTSSVGGTLTGASDGSPAATRTLSADSGQPGTTLPGTLSGTDRSRTILIGTGTPAQLSAVILNKRGFLVDEFAREGYTVQFISYKTDQDAVSALAKGDIDFAYTSDSPVLLAAGGGADIRVIGLASSNPVSPSTIVVRTDDQTISKIAQLKGKRVAFEFGSQNQASLEKGLEAKHLSLGDIKPVNQNFSQAYPALLKGEIDAIVDDYNTVYGTTTFDQSIKGSQRVVTTRIVDSGKNHPDWAQPALISVNGKFARDHGDLVKRIVKQDIAAAEWADSHYSQAANAIAEGTNATLRIVTKTYPAGYFYLSPSFTDSAVNGLKLQAIILRENNLLRGDISWDTLLDRSFF